MGDPRRAGERHRAGRDRDPDDRRGLEREPEFYDAFKKKHPVNRFGTAEELVGPALFLASEAASFVTGHILAVDGGYVAQ